MPGRAGPFLDSRYHSPAVIPLLVALLLVDSSSAFRFRPYDAGLPRSGQWRHGFAVADMNGDGRADLAFSSPRKQAGPPVIFLNRASGVWTRWEEARFPDLPFDYGAVAAADFDGNGANDLAVASHYRGVTVVLGDGKGNFVASNQGLPGSPGVSSQFSSRAVVATDWNGDGRPDVIALSDGPRPGVSGVQLGVSVFENLGGVAWRQLRSVTSDGVHGDALAAGDVDGDGRPDVLTASLLINFRRLLRLGSDPGLESREVVTSLPISLARSVDLRDFDGDGRAEAVIAYASATSPSRSVIELVSFGGAQPPRQIWSAEGGPSIAAVAAGDIDGDGSADVVAATPAGELLTFRGDGRGFVTADATIAAPAWRRGCAPYAVRLADLDGDGRDEVVAVFAGESGCASGGGVEVWRHTTAGKRRSVR